MAEVKWVKLSTSMFDDEKIRVIESMPSGMEICLIWIKLIVLAGKVNDDGCIYLTKDIPYTDDMLAKIFDQRPEIVKSALGAFQKLGMIEILEDRKIALVNWGKHQSIEGMDKIREQTRARVQRLREKRTLLSCNVTSNATVTQVTHPRVRLELDKNKDKEKIDYAEGLKMTKHEYSALVGQYGERVVKLAIEKVAAQQIKTGKKYKSPRGAILQWGIRAALEEIKKLPPERKETPKPKCPECSKSLEREHGYWSCATHGRREDVE